MLRKPQKTEGNLSLQALRLCGLAFAAAMSAADYVSATSMKQET